MVARVWEVLCRLARAIGAALVSAINGGEAASADPPRAPEVSRRRRRARRHLPAAHHHPSVSACATCGLRACDRHCPWCSADLVAGAHAADCPEVTNVYPVAVADGLACWACDDDFVAGDHYSWVEAGDHYSWVEAGDQWVAMCLGCAARSVLGIGFM